MESISTRYLPFSKRISCITPSTFHVIIQIDCVLRASKSFFQAPSDVKNKSRRDPSKSNDGYVGIDQEM